MEGGQVSLTRGLGGPSTTESCILVSTAGHAGGAGVACFTSMGQHSPEPTVSHSSASFSSSVHVSDVSVQRIRQLNPSQQPQHFTALQGNMCPW